MSPRISDLVASTPLDRQRHLDLLRGAAICAVVFGHWLVMTVERLPDGRLVGYTALPGIADFHHLTWILQVMPLFFLVGGASNAISWTRHRAKGGTTAHWLLSRSARTFPPLTMLLLAMMAGTLIATWAGVPQYFVRDAVAALVLPLWFLVVYFAVIALTPALYALHRRAGFKVLWVAFALIVVFDVLRLVTNNDAVAFPNAVWAWLGIHQLGFAWADGTARWTGKRMAAWFAGGLMALVLLTTLGPYPVSMVNVGDGIQNASRPSLALIAMACAQIAFAAFIARVTKAWLLRRRPWTVVVGINAVMLPIFLWHMPAALGAGVVMDALGILPSAQVGTGAWWLGRIPWMLVATALLAVMVGIFGLALPQVGKLMRRYVGKQARRLLGRGLMGVGNRRRGQDAVGSAGSQGPGLDAAARSPRSRLGALLTSLPVIYVAYVSATVGMFIQNSSGPGPHGIFMVPTPALALVLGASAVLALGRGYRKRPGTAAPTPAAPKKHRDDAVGQGQGASGKVLSGSPARVDIPA